MPALSGSADKAGMAGKSVTAGDVLADRGREPVPCPGPHPGPAGRQAGRQARDARPGPSASGYGSVSHFYDAGRQMNVTCGSCLVTEGECILSSEPAGIAFSDDRHSRRCPAATEV